MMPPRSLTLPAGCCCTRGKRWSRFLISRNIFSPTTYQTK